MSQVYLICQKILYPAYRERFVFPKKVVTVVIRRNFPILQRVRLRRRGRRRESHSQCLQWTPDLDLSARLVACIDVHVYAVPALPWTGS